MVIESQDFQVDERDSEVFAIKKNPDTGERIMASVKMEYTSKGPYEGNNSYNDPFVTADSLVTNGNAILLVCCVGSKSTRGDQMKKIEDDDVDTKLQRTLKNLESQFIYISLIACFIILLVLMLMGVLSSTIGNDEQDATNV